MRTSRHYAGEIINDAKDDVAAFASAGAVLFPTGTAAVDAAAALARKLVLKGAAAESAEALEGLLSAAVTAASSGDAAAAQATADAAVPLASVQTGADTLVAGAVTIASANITAGSVIVPIRDRELGTPGDLTIDTVVPGAPGSFNIQSSNGADVSTVHWLVIG